jgi:hypothetical protein
MRKDGRQSVIRLPNGRTCSIRTYCQAWRKLKALPPDAQIKGFEWFEDDAARVLRRLRDGMHGRINRHISGYGRGRKWDQDWQRHTRLLANDVNRPRLIVRESTVPFEFRSRLAHRITPNDEW